MTDPTAAPTPAAVKGESLFTTVEAGLIQAAMSMSLDAMVDDDGQFYETTRAALNAIGEARAALSALRTERATLTAEIDALRAALAPFIAAKFSIPEPYTGPYGADTDGVQVFVTLGDLRRACVVRKIKKA